MLVTLPTAMSENTLNATPELVSLLATAAAELQALNSLSGLDTTGLEVDVLQRVAEALAAELGYTLSES